MSGCKVIYEELFPKIWGCAQIFEEAVSHIWPMTMQPPPSGFPYIWGKFSFLFYQCTWIVNVVSTAVLLICAGGAEAARAARVIGGLSLEAGPLTGGGEVAGATRLAGGRHTRRVWPHSHRQALLQPTELTSSDEKNNQNSQNSRAISTVCAILNVFLTFFSLCSGHTRCVRKQMRRAT